MAARAVSREEVLHASVGWRRVRKGGQPCGPAQLIGVRVAGQIGDGAQAELFCRRSARQSHRHPAGVESDGLGPHLVAPLGHMRKDIAAVLIAIDRRGRKCPGSRASRGHGHPLHRLAIDVPNGPPQKLGEILGGGRHREPNRCHQHDPRASQGSSEIHKNPPRPHTVSILERSEIGDHIVDLFFRERISPAGHIAVPNHNRLAHAFLGS